MREYFVLKVLRKFRFVFSWLEVDCAAVLSILRVKLIMDGRRVPTIMAAQQPKEGNLFVKSLPIYLLFGLFLLFLLILPVPVYLVMNFVYGMMLFMLISSLISEFSSVLLDVSEKEILLPKPVDNRTVNVAKVLHILIYIMAILLALSLPVMVVGTVKNGLMFLAVFCVLMPFVAGFSIFLTSLLYYFILRLFDSERLKDVINYFQIGLSVFIVIGFQFMGRVFSFVDLDFQSVKLVWWSGFIPTTWFSAPYALFVDKIYEPVFFWVGSLGIALPVLFFLVYLKLVAPYFESNLAKLNDASGERKGRKGKLLNVWAQLLCATKKEKGFYLFSKRLLASERSFKLRLYPILAMAVFFPLIFLLNSLGFGQSFLSGLRRCGGQIAFFTSIFP